MARGRFAEAPHEIPRAGWKDIFLRVKDEIAADHVGLIAAGVAFYALLALFPAIAAAVALTGLFTEPGWLVSQIEGMAALLPQQATEIILTQAKEVAGSEEGGLGLAALVGIGLALYSASKGMASLIEGLNVAYDETEKRGFVMLTLVKLGLTVFLILGLLLAAAVSVAIPVALQFIHLGPATELLIQVVSWIVLLLLATAGLAFIYRKAPSRVDAKWRWVTPGAFVAILLWAAGSLAFGWYVSNFGSYNETFGTLGGAVVLLMWLWLSAFIILLGAELDAEIEAQTRVDTTVGPGMPMGERGAVKADTLGEARA